jgi:prepilin signal peptidase PulO-like enzyme (type II secretory pathway)
MIPVVSFLVQGGKCATCKSAISWQYPVVELLTAGVFAAIAYKIPLVLSWFGVVELLTVLVASALLIVIVVYDMKHKIIPDLYIYLLIGLSFLSLFVITPGNIALPSLAATLAGPILAAPFALLWLISKGTWMGLGDAKIALAIGWFIGLSVGVAAIFIAFLVGALVGIFLILAGKFLTLFARQGRFTIKSEMPFAPFLALGLAIVWYWNISFNYVSALFL